MPVEPTQAQAMFVTDIAPELHKLRGFSLYKDVPGMLAFGDGRNLSGGEPGVAGEPALWMRRLSERRIRVSFTAEPPGTRVTLRGGAERDVRDALVKPEKLVNGLRSQRRPAATCPSMRLR
jgi:hypothetical protein